MRSAATLATKSQTKIAPKSPRSSGVEHFLGKEEVSGSIPDVGSTFYHYLYSGGLNMAEKKEGQSKVARALEKAASRKAKLRDKNQEKEAKAAAKKPSSTVQAKNSMPQPHSKGIKNSAGTALRNTTKSGMRGA